MAERMKDTSSAIGANAMAMLLWWSLARWRAALMRLVEVRAWRGTRRR